jgi:hypothetical protein
MSSSPSDTANGSLAKTNGCRPFSETSVINKVIGPIQTVVADDHTSPALNAIEIDSQCPLAGLDKDRPAKFNTGPPPDNLVVTLCRFII